jgi:methyl-accepting chemotaxis protein
MMNSSSLSKATLLVALGLACAACGLAVGLAEGNLWQLAIGFLGLLSLAGACAYLRRLTQILRRAATIAGTAARGDLEARILEVPESGVVGILQCGLNDVLDISDAFVREASGSMRYVSEGKYFRKVLLRGLPGAFAHAARTMNEATAATDARIREFRGVTVTFEENVGGVVDSVSTAASQLHANAESMARAADEASRRAAAIASATQQASANVQTVATAADELSASIGEIGRQVTHSSQIARKATDVAEETSGTVAGLHHAVERIGSVVELIREIAGRTNLLALNANIEAARAGAAGKGFAVVASEVKGLATRTAGATEEITVQIAAIQTATRDAVAAIGAIGETTREMNGIAGAIAAAVEEQGAATREIARNVQEAAAGTREMTTNLVGVSGAVDESGAAANQVLAAAGELSRQADRLSGETGTFLRHARQG